MNIKEIIHIFENSRLVSNYFTDEAVDAAYIEALAALEAQREREHPKPLTWEELIMAKETPVFIVDSKNHQRYWSIVSEQCTAPKYQGIYLYTFGVYNFLYRKGYGETWAAYRYEPKENDK